MRPAGECSGRCSGPQCNLLSQLNQKCLKPVRFITEALGSKTSAIELLKVHQLLQILQNAVDDTKSSMMTPHFFLFKVHIQIRPSAIRFRDHCRSCFLADRRVMCSQTSPSVRNAGFFCISFQIAEESSSRSTSLLSSFNFPDKMIELRVFLFQGRGLLIKRAIPFHTEIFLQHIFIDLHRSGFKNSIRGRFI